MDIITAIQSVGFPIVMCLILVFYLGKMVNKNTTALDQLVELIRDKLK